MSTAISLNFRMTSASGSEDRTVTIENLVIAGWTGRDTAAVEEHIAELEAIGVKRPSRTPCYYRASVDQLTQADEIQVIGDKSSGEAEFIIVQLEDGLWVGLGSDHTDREVEAYNVAVSKQMCAKPIAGELWPMAELADHWDEIQLRSTITVDRMREPYQDGGVVNMLPPVELIKQYRSGAEELMPGTLMFCGTLAVQGGVRPADEFNAELVDPVLGREISYSYGIVTLPPEEE
jgi:hypothetical protein